MTYQYAATVVTAKKYFRPPLPLLINHQVRHAQVATHLPDRQCPKPIVSTSMSAKQCSQMFEPATTSCGNTFHSNKTFFKLMWANTWRRESDTSGPSGSDVNFTSLKETSCGKFTFSCLYTSTVVVSVKSLSTTQV